MPQNLELSFCTSNSKIDLKANHTINYMFFFFLAFSYLRGQKLINEHDADSGLDPDSDPDLHDDY